MQPAGLRERLVAKDEGNGRCRFDIRLRGGPDSGYGVSPWVGPLSALAFNHGYVNGRFQADPPKVASAHS